MGNDVGPSAKNTRRPPPMRQNVAKNYGYPQSSFMPSSAQSQPFQIPGSTDLTYNPVIQNSQGAWVDRVTGNPTNGRTFGQSPIPRPQAPPPQAYGSALAQAYPYSYGGAQNFQNSSMPNMQDPAGQVSATPSSSDPINVFDPNGQSMDMPSGPSSWNPISVVDPKSAPVTPGAPSAPATPDYSAAQATGSPLRQQIANLYNRSGQPIAPPTAPAASTAPNPFQGTDLGDYWNGEGDQFFGVRNNQNFFNGKLFAPEGLSQSTDGTPGGGYAKWLRSSIPRMLKQLPANDPRRSQMTQLLAQVGGPLEAYQDFGP